MGGDTNSKLNDIASTSANTNDRLDSLEIKINSMEVDLTTLKTEFASAKLDRNSMAVHLQSVDDKMDRVLSFVEGTDKVLGFCLKHWRTAAKFGAGVVTAYGVSNPNVQRTLNFIVHFVGM